MGKRVFEAPKQTTAISRLREKAAQSEHFCQLTCMMRQLMIDYCMSGRSMRQALSLAIHEQAWSSYRLQQGAIEETVEEIIEEEEDDEEMV